MIIKAGTYRLNEVNTAPSEVIIQEIDYTCETLVNQGSLESLVDFFERETGLDCSDLKNPRVQKYGDMRVDTYSDGSVCIEGVCVESNWVVLNGEEQVDLWRGRKYIWYSENFGLNESITITILKDTDVSDAFGTWYTANTTEYTESDTPQRLTEKLQSLIVKANLTTGNADTDINGAVNSLCRGFGGNSSPLPIEVATEEEMNALLETAEVGSVYKYTGTTTDTYESGALYIVERNIITFTYVYDHLASRQAEEGMTWGEFVNSEYNTPNENGSRFVVLNDKYISYYCADYAPSEPYHISVSAQSSNGVSVLTTDTIIDGFNYMGEL